VISSKIPDMNVIIISEFLHDNDACVGIVFHEIGHIISKHHDTITTKENAREKELEADTFIPAYARNSIATLFEQMYLLVSETVNVKVPMLLDRATILRKSKTDCLLDYFTEDQVEYIKERVICFRNRVE
jgi:hypothetical protein